MIVVEDPLFIVLIFLLVERTAGEDLPPPLFFGIFHRAAQFARRDLLIARKVDVTDDHFLALIDRDDEIGFAGIASRDLLDRDRRKMVALFFIECFHAGASGF